jgi:putative peptidoglycan lipid II flippase
MLLKAGALSLALLLASRLLGLVRESAQAAAFGTSGLADVAVLMLTLPDLLAGLLASGALAYVLLPAWAGRPRLQVAATQRRVARALIAMGLVLALLLALLRLPAVDWLAGGLPPGLRGVAAEALVWSALAVPAALLAALWITRLQHERDFVGMYGASLVVNAVLVATMAALALPLAGVQIVPWLGVGLLAAMGMRLAWLRWRQGRPPALVPDAGAGAAALPPAPLWLWAALSAGLPLALPFAARSIASHGGEGALATFSYAWKLVELPLVLAIQLVASLAFPAIAASLSPASGHARPAGAEAAVRGAFALAFALACACAAGLLAGAPAVTQLLFGWGRMSPQALARVAQWGQTGAWGLLPQALIAVALTVLAARGRMKPAVLAYGLALAALLAVGTAGVVDGGMLMRSLNVLLAAVAVASILAMGPDARRWLPWRGLAAPLVALLLVAVALAFLPPATSVAAGLALAVASAALVLSAGWLGSRELRIALAR